MIELTDGMLLYHGSYMPVPKIDLGMCGLALDFGAGFYLTSSFDQAYSYVPLAVKKAARLGRIAGNFKGEDGCISVYRFHYEPNLLVHYPRLIMLLYRRCCLTVCRISSVSVLRQLSHVSNL